MKNVRKTISMVLLYILIYEISRIIIGFTEGVLIEISGKNFTLYKDYIYIRFILAAILAGTLYLLTCKKRKIDLYKICNFKKVAAGKIILLIILGFGIRVTLLSLLTYFYDLDILSEYFTKLMSTKPLISHGSYFLYLLAIGVIVPFIEEIIFRGLIFNELEKSFKTHWVIVIQAILFSLVHLQPIKMIYTFLFGMLLGISYVLIKSILAPIIIHIVFNSSNHLIEVIISLDLINNNIILFQILNLLIVIVIYAYFYKKNIADSELW
ncbi:CPBP family intramembrane metalloprotease [Alkaliphilus pronyensis]|uniref:CPBP family intramembrane metalloprotease n=1 Tax=Alkaliphilus pronyensis TaxID=1482732 RepID=A0A6I0FF31_9FIRM|nr:type II CAAX endopeptidase family protein [Alkaliphilus pronyensis]KAB3537846.1 CPBP family intramembrane metalloprotease [Alkaliphilus pronyensis]